MGFGELFGNSWVNVKEIKNIGLKSELFSNNHVLMLADVGVICLYNMITGNLTIYK